MLKMLVWWSWWCCIMYNDVQWMIMLMTKIMIMIIMSLLIHDSWCMMYDGWNMINDGWWIMDKLWYMLDDRCCSIIGYRNDNDDDNDHNDIDET